MPSVSQIEVVVAPAAVVGAVVDRPLDCLGALAPAPAFARTLHGGRPRSTRVQARAQYGSISTSSTPAARRACASASSWLRAPPENASGLRKGSRAGGAVHQATHMNRRRRVVVTEHEATNNPLSATTGPN